MNRLSYPIVRHRLDNGLRVVISEDHTVPVVAVNLWYGVGSRHEEKGRTGFAHLFEHLMLQGSRNVTPGEGEESALGEQGGSFNATTSFDRTNYYSTVPGNALELALWIEANRLKNLPETLDQQILDIQRDVVKEERRQVMDNQPYGIALERALPLLFPPGHPYDHLPIGSMVDLDAATPEDIQSFFHRHYTASNAVLTLAGDIHPEQGFAFVERHFGDVPLRPLPDPAVAELLPPLPHPGRDDVIAPVPGHALFVAFRAPGEPSPDLDALELAVSILSAGGTSRLYNRLIREAPQAQLVSGTVQRLVSGTSFSQFVLVGTPRTGRQELEDALLAELDRLTSQRPTAEELLAAQAQAERKWLGRMGSYAGRANAIGHYTTLFDAPQMVNHRVESIREVTTEQVRAVAATWLNPANRAVVAFHGPAGHETTEADIANAGREVA